MIATYYTAANHSVHLADGHRYKDCHAFCATSKHIPLGTRLEILCPRTGERIIVTVRDRGVGPNVIDLDEQSFKELSGRGWYDRGVERVKVKRYYKKVHKRK